MVKNVVILGAKGDGPGIASFIECLNALKKEDINLLGFLDDFVKARNYGYPVLGKLKDALSLFKRDDIFFVSALLKAKYSHPRSKLIESLNIPLSKFITIIHPTATIARSTKIGVGTVIGPNVNIMPNVSIGSHCSLRSSANVGHDCIIEDFCYMGPNSTLVGRSKMEIGSHLSANASVLGAINIGAYSVVGIGSCVVKDVNNFDVIFGCPPRKVGTANK